MTDEEYSKLVYALWQAGLENSERAKSLHEQVLAASTALKNSSTRLPDELVRALHRELPTAADNAAKMIANRWTEANTHAERATAAYREATVQARKTVLRAVVLLIGAVTFVLIAFGLALYKRIDQLAYMHDEKARLETTMEQLTRRGSLANIQKCYDSKQSLRLCVRIDENAKVSDKRLRVIKGY